MDNWQDSAACADLIDPKTSVKATTTRRIELYFPSDERLLHKVVIDTCLSCPVLEACRNWSIENLQYGYSGGLTENQRARIRSERNRNSKCGTRTGYNRHRERGEIVPPIEEGGCGCLEVNREKSRVFRAAKKIVEQQNEIAS
jgi:Transcription factor WhiB